MKLVGSADEQGGHHRRKGRRRRDGVIDSLDDAYETLLAFNATFFQEFHYASALSRVIIVDGVVM